MKYTILCKINIAYTFIKIEALLFQEGEVVGRIKGGLGRRI